MVDNEVAFVHKGCLAMVQYIGISVLLVAILLKNIGIFISRSHKCVYSTYQATFTLTKVRKCKCMECFYFLDHKIKIISE
jgi:hypothetical protein